MNKVTEAYKQPLINLATATLAEEPILPASDCKAILSLLAELEAALSAKEEAEPVVVKPLVWVQGRGQNLHADSVVGPYHVELNAGDWRFYFGSSYILLSTVGALDEAKAAAQADYEHRILSAVTPTLAKSATVQAEEDAGADADMAADLLVARSAASADTAQVQALVDALRPFAEFARANSSDTLARLNPDDIVIARQSTSWARTALVTLGDFRAARAALSALSPFPLTGEKP
jgi:plasmid stabilization system protein ParE